MAWQGRVQHDPSAAMAGTIALGRGISGGLKSLGEGIARANEQKKQEGQLSTALRKTLSIAYPDRKDEFNTMGLGDLQGTLEGEAMKSGMAKMKRQAEKEDLLMALEQQKLDAARATPGIMARLAESGQDPANVPAPLNNAEFDRRTAPLDVALMDAFAKSGAPIDLRDAGGLMEALQRMRADNVNWEDIKPREFTTSRGESGVYGKSGQFQLSPSTERFQAPVQPKVVVAPDPLTGEPRVSWTGSPEDFSKQFPGQKLPTGEAATAPAQSGPMPMPKTKGELKKGATYQTPRGLATWDGERFVAQ